MKRMLIVVALLSSACASRVGEFDFRNPGCVPQYVPKFDKVEVRSTGSGGVLIRWKEEAVLVGPFFSNHWPLRAQFGRAVPDEFRVRDELSKLRIDDVCAILAGHSHYDHLGDVPFIVQNYLPHAQLYVNHAGSELLAPYPFNVTMYEGAGTLAITPFIRFTAYQHGHAPQLRWFGRTVLSYAKGRLFGGPWKTEWDQRKLRHLKGGTAHAFLIELHDETGERFRIYYNDAAEPLRDDLPAGPVDLAILCLPGSQYSGGPEALLDRLKPRHVLITHVENFFEKHVDSWTFPFGLRAGHVRDFVETVEKCVVEPEGPVNEICGPSNAKWSMPVPRSQLWFNPR